MQINCKGMFTKVLVSFFLLFSLSVTTKAQHKVSPACPLGASWKFVPEFSDEFNGKGLDNEKWWDFNPTWYGRKPGYFSRENVKVTNGTLCLTARVQHPRKVTVEHKAWGFDKFTTSSVKSKERIRYGYFEARCKSMKAGVCNAFWLYDPLDPPAKHREGSFSEEIDIFELFGNRGSKKEYNCDNVFYANVHRFATPYVESIVNTPTPLDNQRISKVMPFDIHADFHTYALLWTPKEMKWYVDGIMVFTRDNDHYTTALHIMFDCEIMPDWVGLPDPSDLPATFYIDYLRVWKFQDL